MKKISLEDLKKYPAIHALLTDDEVVTEHNQLLILQQIDALVEERVKLALKHSRAARSAKGG